MDGGGGGVISGQPARMPAIITGCARLAHVSRPGGSKLGRRRFAPGPGADKGALRWCTSDATVAFTGPGPSSPLAGIGGMSASPAGSSKRGDYP